MRFETTLVAFALASASLAQIRGMGFDPHRGSGVGRRDVGNFDTFGTISTQRPTSSGTLVNYAAAGADQEEMVAGGQTENPAAVPIDRLPEQEETALLSADFGALPPEQDPQNVEIDPLTGLPREKKEEEPLLLGGTMVATPYVSKAAERAAEEARLAEEAARTAEENAIYGISPDTATAPVRATPATPPAAPPATTAAEGASL